MNLRHYKRTLCLILYSVFLCFFTGCKEQPPQVPECTPSPAASSFSSFTDNLFREYAASDSLSLHYTVLHPEQLQIEKPVVSLGSFNADTLLASSDSANENLALLHTFTKNDLEPSEQLLYDLLEYALTYSVLPSGTALYSSPLGPTTGLQTQLPILLAEYRFSSRSDIEDYFLLLSDLPNYFSDICDFEKARSAAGTQVCSEVLSRIILQCTSFIENPGDNFLISSFKDRLATVPNLTATEIAELCVENQKLVFTKVIPAYEQLIEVLSSLLDTSVPAHGLCALPNGAEYYEHMVHSQTGSNRSMAEIESMLEDALKENMLTLLTLYQSETLQAEFKTYQKNGLSVHSDAVAKPSENEPKSAEKQKTVTASAHSSVLEELKQQILTDFPTPTDAAFRVNMIHPSLEDFISPALYLVPPLDAYKENVIYINPAKCSKENLFSTLAHEGYPGHLYQNTYFAATSPHPLRMLLNFTGYDEGWGTYAELYSYQYADCSEELKQFLIAEQIVGLCLYSLSDIKIHFHGADLSAITAFLEKYGFSSETATEIYYTQLAEPVIYLPYSVGYLEFCALRDRYYTLAGDDASLLPFHTFLLETGPAPFSVLNTLMELNF